MEKNNKEILRILHVGADPEFISPIAFENLLVEIETTDNPFSVSQWILSNGLPDAVICEVQLPGGTGFAFYDFWVEQFDQDLRVPFILLDEEKNEETASIARGKGIEDLYIKPLKAEVLISRILTIQGSKSQLQSRLISEMNAFKPYQPTFLKRTFDLVTASIGLIIFSPILLICAIAIRFESKGNVFYTSQRVGSGFTVFKFYKLRSMYITADKRLKDLTQRNEFSNENQGSKHLDHIANPVLHSDPRITRVGQFVRHLNIDEIPQFYNVIKGDMSIVGNRPLPIYEAELLTTSDWADRFHSPAGITGIWKAVTRRKLRSMSHEERNRLQNQYSKIANSSTSFWKDIWIIIRTVI
jgi:lipopolysaccharide/colanic/teichoic acid biosynthesis glycosyltransferase